MKYIIYKLINYIACKFFTMRMFPLLRVENSRSGNKFSFFFDLSCSTTHLGDRLFFLPLICSLVRLDVPLVISDKDNVTGILLKEIFGIVLQSAKSPDESQTVICPSPSYLNLFRLYPALCLVDFNDSICTNKITHQLISSFGDFLNTNLAQNHFHDLHVNTEFSNGIFDPTKKYILFSNYIDSGRFRRFFVDQNRLYSKIEKLKTQGFMIIHVGTKGDKISDHKFYPFVDHDLRGKTSIQQLIALVQAKNVIGAVTYDNFLMHLIGMYGKVAFVLFRGRFSQKNRDHHMLHVNNTFFDHEERLIYL